ncbi:MFS family permease [Bradyrhizobium sp. LM3.2]
MPAQDCFAQDRRPPPDAHPARLILTLSLAATVGLGIGRFAYALVLPDMREDLGWSYSAAGFMNTINAVGYLAGALVASRLIQRVGWAAAIRGGTLACVAALATCALTGNFVALSLARLVLGFGAAAGFVAGGALAASIAQSRPLRANFLLSLFYAGPGIGILASGLIAPFTLQYFGPGSWWIVWWALTLLSVVMTVPLFLVRIESGVRFSQGGHAAFAIVPVLIYLAGYFLFGAGYIAYMTFMIAYVRDGGGGPAAQAAFWSLIGPSAPSSRRGPGAACSRSIAADLPPPSSSAPTRSAPPCRCSGIRRHGSRSPPSCSASPSSPWSARPPPSCASTTRPRCGRPRSRR